MKSEKKIRLEMMTTADVRTTAEVRRIKFKQLKKVRVLVTCLMCTFFNFSNLKL